MLWSPCVLPCHLPALCLAPLYPVLLPWSLPLWFLPGSLHLSQGQSPRSDFLLPALHPLFSVSALCRLPTGASWPTHFHFLLRALQSTFPTLSSGSLICLPFPFFPLPGLGLPGCLSLSSMSCLLPGRSFTPTPTTTTGATANIPISGGRSIPTQHIHAASGLWPHASPSASLPIFPLWDSASP